MPVSWRQRHAGTKLVAAIFTSNSGVGRPWRIWRAVCHRRHHRWRAPTWAPVLSANAWDAACRAVYKQPIKNNAALRGTGAGDKPGIILIPRAAKKDGHGLCTGALVEGLCVRKRSEGSAVPVVVPDWSDERLGGSLRPARGAGDFVGERFGLAPEIFVAGDELPSVFSNDEHRLVRHYLRLGE